MIAAFVLAGQSNVDEWFNTGDQAALLAFEETFLALNPQYTAVEFFDAARGGSAMLSGSATQYAETRAADDPDLYDRIAQNYWYDETTGTAGPNLELFTERLEAEVAAGTEFLGIIWAQGEADTTYVDEATVATYAEGLEYVLGQLMEASGAPQVYIQALGDRAFYSEDLHGGTDDIRAAQQAVADGNDAITLATTIFDLELRDSVHLVDEAYEIAARRMAIAISTGETSPAVSETLLLDSHTILIQLDLAPGQSVSGSFTTGGFSITEDGAKIGILDITMTEAGLLRIVTSEPVSSPTVSYASARDSILMAASDYIQVTGANGAVPILPFKLAPSEPALTTVEIPGGLAIEGTDLSQTLTGLSGDDILTGNGGHDTLVGGSGSDQYYGGAGSDVFVPGDDGRLDTVHDFDIVRDAIGLFGGTKDGATFRQVGATDIEVETADGARILLKNVSIDDADEILFHTLGTDAANMLTGHDGDDRIFAMGGDDVIDSGAGTDRITTGDGADTILFGTGYGLNIVYDFDLSQDRIVLTDLASSSLVFLDYNGTDLELRTASGDRLVLRDVSLADAGLVEIVDAPPTVGFLTGTEQGDFLRGTDLDELFVSLGGTDRLWGGGGRDVFAFHKGTGLDVVYDFEDGVDRILVDAEDFDGLRILTYGGRDAEIRLDSGDRLVLRNVDAELIDADDFIFAVPDDFL